MHFVLIGGLIFTCYQTFDPEAKAPGETEIRVSPGRVTQLAAIFQKTWQRPPTRAELEGLVDDFVKEEIYYREAKSAGLDQDDTLIRRRLRQKMEFLTDDLAVSQPDDEALKAFVEQNPERFALPVTTTFRQVFFNPDKLGAQPDDALAAAAALLEEGEEPEGHTTLLPAAMQEATPSQIAGTFGTAFAEELAGLEVGGWSGPLRSSFGFHFVKVEGRESGGSPEFDRIRAQVQREWEHEKRQRFREEFDQKLLERYEVSVQWPEIESPQG